MKITLNEYAGCSLAAAVIALSAAWAINSMSGCQSITKARSWDWQKANAYRAYLDVCSEQGVPPQSPAFWDDTRKESQ